MIINTNGQMPNMPNMVKRGFNQTPSDIRDNRLASQLAYQKQVQIMKNKENNLNTAPNNEGKNLNETLSSQEKIEALKKLNNEV